MRSYWAVLRSVTRIVEKALGRESFTLSVMDIPWSALCGMVRFAGFYDSSERYLCDTQGSNNFLCNSNS